MEISGHSSVIKLRCFSAEDPRAVSVSHRGSQQPLTDVCVCVCKLCVLCICFHVLIHTSIFKFIHFKTGAHTYCICVLTVSVSVCVCVSCWWYFPRAPCYAGQLLHPSCFDSSAAPPGGPPPHTTQKEHARVYRYACVTAMTTTLCEPWHMHTHTNHISTNRVMHH